MPNTYIRKQNRLIIVSKLQAKFLSLFEDNFRKQIIFGGHFQSQKSCLLKIVFVQLKTYKIGDFLNVYLRYYMFKFKYFIAKLHETF